MEPSDNVTTQPLGGFLNWGKNSYLTSISNLAPIDYLFLSFVMVAGNYLGSMFSTTIKYTLNNSFLAQLVTVCFTAFLFISYIGSNAREDKPEDIGFFALQAFCLTLGFWLFTVQHRFAIIILLMLLPLTYLIRLIRNTFIKKIEHGEQVDQSLIDGMSTTIIILNALMCFIAIIGMFAYIFQQKSDRGEGFDPGRFARGGVQYWIKPIPLTKGQKTTISGSMLPGTEYGATSSAMRLAQAGARGAMRW